MSASQTEIGALAEAREKVVPLLQTAVAGVAPPIARVVEYHMGWADRDGRPVDARGSKSIRPALALLSARAAGSESSVAYAGGVAVECLHNFSFLHDDVMDGDRYRRHRETAWVVFGPALAICAGDALLTLAQRTVAGHAAALALVQRTAAEMIDGQALDLALTPTPSFDTRAWTQMARLKTGALLGCATAIGAALADADAAFVSKLTDFGRLLGLAFQAVDDALGVWGTPATTGGRRSGFDIRARQASLPVALVLERGDAPAAALLEILGRDELNDADVAAAVAILDGAATRERTLEFARSRIADATRVLHELEIAKPIADEFLGLTSLGTEKEIA